MDHIAWMAWTPGTAVFFAAHRHDAAGDDRARAARSPRPSASAFSASPPRAATACSFHSSSPPSSTSRGSASPAPARSQPAPWRRDRALEPLARNRHFAWRGRRHFPHGLSSAKKKQQAGANPDSLGAVTTEEACEARQQEPLPVVQRARLDRAGGSAGAAGHGG